jgi:hypothetical protein
MIPAMIATVADLIDALRAALVAKNYQLAADIAEELGQRHAFEEVQRAKRGGGLLKKLFGKK